MKLINDKGFIMLKIFHNPECSKSNCALDYLNEHHIAFELRNYLLNPLSVAELNSICQLLQVSPFSLVRKNELLYKEKFFGKEFSDEEWLKILSENPVLLQRPIVLNDGKAVVARPAEKINELL